MLEIVMEILHEVNMTTSNLIYLFLGGAIFFIIEKLNKKEDKIVWLYMSAVDFYNSLRTYLALDPNLLSLYNNILIRSICILAMDGEFAKKETTFINNDITNLDNIDDQSKEIIRVRCNEFITKVVEYEHSYSAYWHGHLLNFVLRRRR